MRRGAREQLQQPRHRRRSAHARWARCRSACSSSSSSSRVLFSGARIIILDEPTSALSPPEVERLFGVLRRLRDAGRSIIFISHFLDDMLAICDRVTVFRNGRKVATEPCADDRQALGHRPHDRRRPRGAGGELSRRISRCDSRRTRRSCWRRTDLTLAPVPIATSRSRCARGEVLGIYGFMGCGQLELARTLFGKLPPERGRVAIDGRSVRPASARHGRGAPASPSCRKAGA